MKTGKLYPVMMNYLNEHEPINQGIEMKNNLVRNLIPVNFEMQIDWKLFKEQKGYIVNEHCNNPENGDLAGIVAILDAITDSILDKNPELEA